MPCPPGCPRRLYDIMMDCWKENEHDRPAFHYVTSSLEELRESFQREGKDLRSVAVDYDIGVVSWISLLQTGCFSSFSRD